MKDYVPLMQTALWIGLAVVIVLRFAAELKQRIKTGGFAIGWLRFEELKTAVDDVQGEVRTLNNKVTNLFLHTMSDDVYLNLHKIVSGHFGTYEKGTALDRELRFLREFGFVRTASIKDIPYTGPELSEYVTATDTGRQFVALSADLGRRPVPETPAGHAGRR